MMRKAAERKSRFDAVARAGDLEALDAAATVLPCEIFGGGSRHFDDARIENELLCIGRVRDVHVCDRLRGGLDCGLASAQLAGTGDDAILGGPKADDRRGGNAQHKNDGEDRLAAFASHGAHSIRRAAVPSMIKRGTPTKPRGIGIA